MPSKKKSEKVNICTNNFDTLNKIGFLLAKRTEGRAVRIITSNVPPSPDPQSKEDYENPRWFGSRLKVEEISAPLPVWNCGRRLTLSLLALSQDGWAGRVEWCV